MLGLTSAEGILALLDEPTDDLKVYALKKLDVLVDEFWAEISDHVTKIEILHENEAFGNRQLAALVASKVYYHLGEFGDSLQFALQAENEFDVTGKSLYVETIIGKAIDKYTEQRKQLVDEHKEVTIDKRLEDIVNRMFARCFASRSHRQALGVALEARRMDMLEKALTESDDLSSMLSYCFEVVLTLIRCLEFRHCVINVLAKHFKALPTPDHLSTCQCYVVLDQSTAVADLLFDLLSTNKLMALQTAFDLYENATQRFLANVRKQLSAKAPSTSTTDDSSMDTAEDKEATIPELVEKVNTILAGDVTLCFNVEFLSRRNNADKLILANTKDAIQRSSICHSATVMSNSFMYAGTTSDEFLRENVEWLGRATNWAKFSAVASLGVIHKGHVTEAKNVLSPYLPKPDVAGSPYEKGGSLYALGLVYANHGAEVTGDLVNHITAEGATEVVQHGGCLGLGLAAMASHSSDLYDALKNVLYTDSAVAGEAAGIGMGLVMLGSGNEDAIQDMFQYAEDTQHEKIIRGLSVGIALSMYNLQERADTLISRLEHNKDAILRTSCCYTIAMAYIATGNNSMIRKLLHTAVSDVNEDVRRAAVTSIGFLLLRTPEHVPSVVSLLCESFNPHVRFGSCMALGIACAATGLKEAIALVEPMTTDSVPFVRQGALVALALIMMQAPNSHPKAESTRKLYAKVIADKHEDVLAKMGAIYAQGLMEAGGRNVTINLARGSGHTHMPSAVGMLVFTQFWFWFPLGHFISLAFQPTGVVCLNEDLKMPKIDIMSNLPPSTFAYPPKTEPPKEKSKEKVKTAVLSITSKAKAKAKKDAGESSAMDVDKPETKTEEKKVEDDKEKEKEEEEKKDEPEADFEMLTNPARVVPKQLGNITYPADCRYAPVRSGPMKSGITILRNSKPGEEEDLIEMKPPSATSDAPDTAGEPEPPQPFEFKPELEDE